jgi:hypothetical protein
MSDLLLVGGPNAGRHLHSTHDANETLYTMTVDGPCVYQHASTVVGGDGEPVELYVCEDVPQAEGARLIADVAKTL